jgi:hypothetical protein
VGGANKKGYTFNAYKTWKKWKLLQLQFIKELINHYLLKKRPTLWIFGGNPILSKMLTLLTLRQ